MTAGIYVITTEIEEASKVDRGEALRPSAAGFSPWPTARDDGIASSLRQRVTVPLTVR